MAKISIHEAPAWVAKLGKQKHAAALRGVRSAGERLVAHIVTEIIPREPRIPVDRGIYRAGWRTRPLPNGVLVYNGTPHATFIEDGVRGDHVKVGRAMVDALAEWVKRKGLTGAAKKEETRAQARSIAMAIAQSMKKKGIFGGGKGLKILARAEKKVDGFLDEEVKRELEKAG